jgi:RNA polymerase sigma factor (sigma-70 family)
MDARTDAELIAASLADPEVFEELFARYFPAVHRYLCRRLGEDVAGDVAADVFLVAFRRRDRFRGGRRLALPWLYGIAGNLVQMHRRSEERRLRAFARAAGEARIGLEDFSDAADHRVDAAAARRDLAGALLQLSPPLRETLALSVWGELSDAEIAQALDCTPGAVRTRLSRARAQLTACLRERKETVQR